MEIRVLARVKEYCFINWWQKPLIVDNRISYTRAKKNLKNIS